MKDLTELIEGFQENVENGFPCEMRYDGERVQLYPLPYEVWDKEAKDKDED